MRLINAHEVSDTKFEKPFRVIVGGGSGCGKTTVVKKIVDQNHFSTPFEKIIYIYPEYLLDSPIEFDQIVEYRSDISDITYYSSLGKNTLIIIDDMMNECGKSDDIMKLFSVVARKRDLSIIFIVQNIYDNSKQFRNIRLNATGFLLFKFYASTDTNSRLLRDLGLKNIISKRQLADIFSSPFAYIFVNIHPGRQNYFSSVTANIFEKYYSIFKNMEYVAIPKNEFLKYFKIIEAKRGSIKAIKNEVTIGDDESDYKNTRKTKSAKRKRQSRNYKSTDSETEYTSSE